MPSVDDLRSMIADRVARQLGTEPDTIFNAIGIEPIGVVGAGGGGAWRLARYSGDHTQIAAIERQAAFMQREIVLVRH